MHACRVGTRRRPGIPAGVKHDQLVQAGITAGVAVLKELHAVIALVGRSTRHLIELTITLEGRDSGPVAAATQKVPNCILVEVKGDG